jgi:hypothetical protein
LSINSKFPDHECKKCGVTIKKGDPVNKITATGQWCSNEKCPNPPTATEAPGPEPGPAAATTPASLRNFVRDESYKLQTIEAMVLETVPEETKKNGQKVGMYVKEIYRTWNNRNNATNGPGGKGF